MWLRAKLAERVETGGAMYLGSDSAGFCKMNPRRAADFSPCLPNPYPAFSVLLHDPLSEAAESWRLT